MAKIKIKDLPKNKKISKQDMKAIAGGSGLLTNITPDLSLKIFPQFKPGDIQFRTAAPNEDGASKMNIKL